MIDTHTHTCHSHDSALSPEALLQAASEKGCELIAVTNHCDRDIVGVRSCAHIAQLDVDRTFRELSALQARAGNRTRVAVGLECGWAKFCEADYTEILSRYPWDFVINSIHMTDGEDLYMPSYFAHRDKIQAYTLYLQSVRASLDAPYPYETIGHVGYVMRKAPYPDNAMRYADHADLLDDILRTLVEKGKALELNSNAKGTQQSLLPSREILVRYRELGGELLTFGSDAHTADRIGDKYDIAAAMAREAGFRYFFGFLQHRPIAFPIES